MVTTLADVIHAQLCTAPAPCGYDDYGGPHREWYRERAVSLWEKLEPQIGGTNVVLAVRVILAELA